MKNDNCSVETAEGSKLNYDDANTVGKAYKDKITGRLLIRGVKNRILCSNSTKNVLIKKIVSVETTILNIKPATK